MDPAFLKMNLSGLIGGDKILQTMIDHAGGDWKIEDLPRKFGAGSILFLFSIDDYKWLPI